MILDPWGNKLQSMEIPNENIVSRKGQDDIQYHNWQKYTGNIKRQISPIAASNIDKPSRGIYISPKHQHWWIHALIFILIHIDPYIDKATQ